MNRALSRLLSIKRALHNSKLFLTRPTMRSSAAIVIAAAMQVAFAARSADEIVQLPGKGSPIAVDLLRKLSNSKSCRLERPVAITTVFGLFVTVTRQASTLLLGRERKRSSQRSGCVLVRQISSGPQATPTIPGRQTQHYFLVQAKRWSRVFLHARLFHGKRAVRC